MVCRRCVMAVEQLLDSLDLQHCEVRMGEVNLPVEPTPEKLTAFRSGLQELGFEIVDDHKGQIIHKIKTKLIELVHGNEELPKVHLSKLLTEDIHYDYNYLSSLFSEVTGSTIEKFFIAQKIEKVKELLVYNQWTLSEIAWRMGYSSVAHLSNQFKKVTGLSPSHFKKIGVDRRKALDEL